MTMLKDVAQLTETDISDHPVWEFNSNTESLGETIMSPVTDLPVSHLMGRLVGTQVALACGVKCPALIGNIDLDDPEASEQLLTISFVKGSTRCHFGMGNVLGGTAQSVADFLGHDVDEVFPIGFDISRWCLGNERSIRGSIHKDVSSKLPKEERIRMALRKAARAYNLPIRK